MSLVITVPPTESLVSLDLMRSQARIDTTDSDDVLALYISAATRRAEAITRRQFAPATYRLGMDIWDDERYARYSPLIAPGIVRLTEFRVLGQLIVELPVAPLISLGSVQYVDTNGATQTLDSSLYTVDAYHEPGRIIQNYGVIWPIHRTQLNAVTITFTAGYSDLDDLRLDPIKLAVMQIATHWYEERRSVSDLSLAPVPQSAEFLLQTERVGGYP